MYDGDKVAIGNICTLPFLCMFLNIVFIKVEKTCLYGFYLQISVLTSMMY